MYSTLFYFIYTLTVILTAMSVAVVIISYKVQEASPANVCPG